ncbi:hypothetical protein GGR54DRAFT_590527 [Hypoxylon sp. NC1633]|nr:hypothetical protein GGR54DRAFT_590527 [Hypoxylon sp. NC1633]
MSERGNRLLQKPAPQMGKSSEDVANILRRCSSFDDLPNEGDPFSERKIFLHNPQESRLGLSQEERKSNKDEAYLRSRWPVSEAIPRNFDPEELKVAMQALSIVHAKEWKAEEDLRLEAADILTDLDTTERYERYEQVPNNREPKYGNNSSEFVYNRPKLQRSESGIRSVSAKDSAQISHPGTTEYRRSRAGIIQRMPAPRILAGSKPPLSRSAYSGAGIPRPRRSGGNTTLRLRRYPRPPKYFPFQSLLRN